MDQPCDNMLFLDYLTCVLYSCILDLDAFVFARIVAAVELMRGAQRALDVIATKDFVFEVLPRVGTGYDGATSTVLGGRARDDGVTHLDVSDDVATVPGDLYKAVRSGL